MVWAARQEPHSPWWETVPLGTRSEKFLVAARTQKPQQTGGTNREALQEAPALFRAGGRKSLGMMLTFSNIFLPPSS